LHSAHWTDADIDFARRNYFVSYPTAPLPLRVLVVDDDAGIRNVCSMLLLNAGYLVETAEDGFSARLSIRADLPNLVLSDLNMPHMSGFEFLSVVRRRFPQIMVIAMSGAYESREDVPLASLRTPSIPKVNPAPYRY
jgi:CheY-like chemotaxis protein